MCHRNTSRNGLYASIPIILCYWCIGFLYPILYIRVLGHFLTSEFRYLSVLSTRALGYIYKEAAQLEPMAIIIRLQQACEG